MNERALALNRRRFLECFSAGGLALMPGALMAVAQDAPRITREMLEAAAKIAGVSFSPQEQESILARLNSGAGPLPGALRFPRLWAGRDAWRLFPYMGTGSAMSR